MSECRNVENSECAIGCLGPVLSRCEMLRLHAFVRRLGLVMRPGLDAAAVAAHAGQTAQLVGEALVLRAAVPAVVK